MSDVFTPEKRSEVMSRIRARDNKRTELALAAFFRANKFSGWRRHYPIVGRPDFVFQTQRVAVFVDGCFWHGCQKHFKNPVGNHEFWKRKIEANRVRDRKVTRELRMKGWRVLRIWEHQLSKRNSSHLKNKIRRYLESQA